MNSLVKNDTIKYNNERIEKAGDENEIWKIVKEVTCPNGEKKWTLEENGESIEEESKISELFNDFFITKIQDIKANIDQTKVENPYTKLEKKMKQKKLKFSLSQVSAKTVEKAIKRLKMKSARLKPEQYLHNDLKNSKNIAHNQIIVIFEIVKQVLKTMCSVLCKNYV